MEHSFDIEIAKQYGINAAILLKNIYFWVCKNKANNKHFYEGKYWTYNSTKAFMELFPYLGDKQIRGALKVLESNGLICTGEFNEIKYDRTKWYAITEKGFALIEHREEKVEENGEVEPSVLLPNGRAIMANGLNQKGEPIPDSKPDSKPDTVDTYMVEIVNYFNEKAEKRYRTKNEDTKGLIAKLLKAGFTVEDFKTVIDNQVASWKGNPEWEKYLRPSTLFNSKKFENYLNNKPGDKKQREDTETSYNIDAYEANYMYI